MIPESLPQNTKVKFYIDGIVDRTNAKIRKGKIVGYQKINQEKYYIIEPDEKIINNNLFLNYSHIICHENWIVPLGIVSEERYTVWQRIVAAFANRHPRALFK